MYRNNVQKSFSEYCMDPLTPPRSYTVKKNGDEDDSPRDFSPGLLDLHSFDTELLPQVYLFSFFVAIVVEYFCSVLLQLFACDLVDSVLERV